MFSQEFLRHEAEGRGLWSRECDEDDSLGNDFRAVAVVSGFNPVGFVESSYSFTSILPIELRKKWCASYTRTIYLAGEPDNIADRFSPVYRSADGSVAWYGPDKSAATENLRKLLRPLSGNADIGDAFEGVQSGSRKRESNRTATLAVERHGTTADRYAIHSNHVISESLAMGLLDGTDFVQLVLVDQISDEGGPYDYLRIAADREHPELLRCYAALKLNPSDRIHKRSTTVDIGSADLRPYR